MNEGQQDETADEQPGPRNRPARTTESPTSQDRPASSDPASQANPLPEAESATQHNARHLSETSGSAYLYCSMAQVFREVGPDAYKAYLTQVLADAGDPTDPIERMLVEQITLAHHNVGRLHVKAASAGSLEEARVYLGSAALLTGEFRRTVATLKSYREPASAAQERPGVPTGGEAPAAKLGSNDAPGATDHDATIVPFAAEPEAGAGGPDEPREAEGADRRRGRKAPRRGVG